MTGVDLDVELVARAGRHDEGQRRQSQRSGRERGCWVYVPAVELVRAGVDLDGPPPLYRTWGARRGSVLVRLYRDTSTEKGAP